MINKNDDVTADHTILDSELVGLGSVLSICYNVFHLSVILVYQNMRYSVYIHYYVLMPEFYTLVEA